MNCNRNLCVHDSYNQKMFLTSDIDKKMDEILHEKLYRNVMTLSCTGGGAHKFSRIFEEKLGITLIKRDEMDCLIEGLNFVLNNVPDECYTWKNVTLDSTGDGAATKTKRTTHNIKDLYPFLLVNIGSGVSILKVSSPKDYERVSGTSLGGGTFFGLASLLLAPAQTRLRLNSDCAVGSFEQAMAASSQGDNHTVDMLVGDIYGGDYEKLNLSAATLASSFGKIGLKENPRRGIKEEDLARSLLVMITQNIGQVAYLNAQRTNTKKIYFCGNFLRQNKLACRQLAYAIDFWSKSDMEALFFKHEGFFGGLGAFLNQNSSMEI